MHSSRKIGTMEETTPAPEIKPAQKTLIDIVLELHDRVEALEKRMEAAKDEATAHTLKTMSDEIHQSTDNMYRINS
jgi:molecular chaperone GrpE (heat shock protein)